jgi:hypothetical protein
VKFSSFFISCVPDFSRDISINSSMLPVKNQQVLHSNNERYIASIEAVCCQQESSKYYAQTMIAIHCQTEEAVCCQRKTSMYISQTIKAERCPVKEH